MLRITSTALILVASWFLPACDDGVPTLESCEGITADEVDDYVSGKVDADASEHRDERFVASGIVTLTETVGGQHQITLRATDVHAGGPTTTTLVVDCYHDDEPVEDDVYADSIAALADAQAQRQCWAWYNLVATEATEGENAHYVSDQGNTGSWLIDDPLRLPGDDGDPGRIGGTFEFDAMDEDGNIVHLGGGSFDVPVCRL